MRDTFMNKQVQRIKVPFYKNQLAHVERAILKGELVKGDALELLEDRLKEMFNSKYAVLTSNGFSAIFLTLQALNNREQEVVLPAISTCFSMVNAIKSAGYKLSFSDVDNETFALFNVPSDSIVLSPNHFGKIATWNQVEHEHFTIGDACQSFLSSQHQEQMTDVTILSFYPTKIINGIDGGAILTDNKEIYLKAKEMVSYEEQLTYNELNIFNLRLNNINASFALATLENLDDIKDNLRYRYARLTEMLVKKGISFLEMNKDETAFRLILVFKDKESTKSAFNYFVENKIDVSRELMFICPLSEQHKFPNAKKILDCSFSIPFHPLLTKEELLLIGKVIEELKF